VGRMKRESRGMRLGSRNLCALLHHIAGVPLVLGARLNLWSRRMLMLTSEVWVV
jgi:hypothetical protein